VAALLRKTKQKREVINHRSLQDSFRPTLIWQHPLEDGLPQSHYAERGVELKRESTTKSHAPLSPSLKSWTSVKRHSLNQPPGSRHRSRPPR